MLLLFFILTTIYYATHFKRDVTKSVIRELEKCFMRNFFY